MKLSKDALTLLQSAQGQLASAQANAQAAQAHYQLTMRGIVQLYDLKPEDKLDIDTGEITRGKVETAKAKKK